MFAIDIPTLNFNKTYDEEYTTDKGVHILRELGEENEEIDGFYADVKHDSYEWTYYITFLTKLIHRSLNNVNNTLSVLTKMKWLFESKVIILNDKTQIKETMNGLEFRSIFLKKFENCTADKAIKWLEKK